MTIQTQPNVFLVGSFVPVDGDVCTYIKSNGCLHLLPTQCDNHPSKHTYLSTYLGRYRLLCKIGWYSIFYYCWPCPAVLRVLRYLPSKLILQRTEIRKHAGVTHSSTYKYWEKSLDRLSAGTERWKQTPRTVTQYCVPRYVTATYRAGANIEAAAHLRGSKLGLVALCRFACPKKRATKPEELETFSQFDRPLARATRCHVCTHLCNLI